MRLLVTWGHSAKSKSMPASSHKSLRNIIEDKLNQQCEPKLHTRVLAVSGMSTRIRIASTQVRQLPSS